MSNVPRFSAGIGSLERSIVGYFQDEIAVRLLELNVDDGTIRPAHSRFQRALGDFVKYFRLRGGDARGGIEVQTNRAGESVASFSRHLIEGEMQARAFGDGRAE